MSAVTLYVIRQSKPGEALQTVHCKLNTRICLSLIKKMSSLDDVSEEGKASRAKTFLAEMKKSLSQVNFDCIIKALQNYKTADNLDVLLSETAILTQDANTHGLLRGMSATLQN